LLEAYQLKKGKVNPTKYRNFHKLFETYQLKKGEVNPTKYQNLHELLEAYQLKKREVNPIKYQNFHKLLEAYQLKKGEVNYFLSNDSYNEWKADKTPSLEKCSPIDSFLSLLFTITNLENIPQIQL
jgi:hypothetical protein